jgi:serine/threonine protein kinase
MLQEGTQIGHYRLLRRIGKGGMGYVYLAENIHLNTQQVAIKVINPNILDNPDAQRLFLREAKAVATLDHPHILPLNDYGEVSIDGETYPYMVMPVRMEGTLKEWLEQHGGAGKLSPTTVVKMVEQAASALQHAHDHQILHLDVKPSNFLLRYTMGKQEAPDLLLTDFGLAKVMNTEVSLSNTSRGTPPYMAPEQWKGSPVAATDQYALATMAYEMLTGRTPFQGDLIALMNQHLYTPPPPPSTFRPDLPKAVDEVLLHALAKDPKDRFASVSAFANALRQALLPEDSQLLRTTLIISQQEARKGTNRNLDLPGAKRINVTIPAGVRSGQVLRLSVRGETVGKAASDAVDTLMITIVVAPDTSKSSDGQKISISRRPLPSFRVWLFAGLALLVVLAGIVIYLGGHHGGPTGSGPSTTPIVHKTNPPTTPTTATATPISTTAVTPSPTAIAWQQLYSEATSGSPVLEDPLVDNSHGYGWDEIPTVTEGGTCSFIDKAYHATIDQNNTFYRCTARNTIFGNFAYQVQMVIQKGDEGGVIFRFDRALVTFYYFHISTDSAYRLDIDNQQGFVRTLSEGTSPAIKIGHNQTNMITVIAQGSSIVLYVNEQYVTSVTDSTYSRGSIGVVAQDDFAPTNVAFTNAKVWLPTNGQTWPL